MLTAVGILTMAAALQGAPAPTVAVPPQPPTEQQSAPPAPRTAVPPWPDVRPITHLFQNLFRDVLALPSPETAGILGVGGIGTVLVHERDDRVAAWAAPRGPSSVARVGRIAGFAGVQAAGAISLYVIGKASGDAKTTHVGGDLIRAQMLNGLLTTSIKRASDRERPNGGHYSLPSGHSSASFATATVIDRHYGHVAGLSAFAGAALVVYARVRENQHWLSDTAMGATIGIIAGRTATKDHPGRTWTVVPVKMAGGWGIFVKSEGRSQKAEVR